MFNKKTIRNEVKRLINKQIEDAEKLYATQSTVIDQEAKEKVDALTRAYNDSVALEYAGAFDHKLALMEKLVGNIVGKQYE